MNRSFGLYRERPMQWLAALYLVLGGVLFFYAMFGMIEGGIAAAHGLPDLSGREVVQPAKNILPVQDPSVKFIPPARPTIPYF